MKHFFKMTDSILKRLTTINRTPPICAACKLQLKPEQNVLSVSSPKPLHYMAGSKVHYYHQQCHENLFYSGEPNE